MEKEREFLYSMYNADVVDSAIQSTNSFYPRHETKSNIRLFDLYKEQPDGDEKSIDILHKRIVNQMVYSFLHGANYAVENKIDNINPSRKEEFSDYHNNVDFAVLFDFGDNDFGYPIEHGAKLFCDNFNDLLYKIDSHEWGREDYIKSFEELCKEDTIKEILKLGFFAHQFEREASCISYITYGTPKLQNALDKINHYLEYIPWDKNPFSVVFPRVSHISVFLLI